MKKFFKIFSFTILSIFILLLILPFFFKGKIEKLINDEINSTVNAKVSYDKVSLSLIRNFPNFSVHLDGLTVSGKDKFEGDTLLALNRFAVIVDVSSAFSDVIEINEILIDHPSIYAKVLQDSAANWDIMIDTGDDTPEPETGEASDITVHVNSFRIVNGDVKYDDNTMDMNAEVKGFNLILSGDMSEKITDLSFTSGIDALTVSMEGVKYMNGAQVGLDAKIKADLDKMLFTFLDNELSLNGLALGIEGAVQSKEESTGINLTISAKKSDLKTLLTLVPEVYMKDLEEVKTSGNFSFVTTVKGDFVDSDNLPAFNIDLAVNDGKIQYPDLPESIDNINIHCAIDNPGGSPDGTVTNLEKFHFMLAGNPFDAGIKIINPVSNPAFSGKAVGKIDLGSLSNAIPIDSFTIKGVITTDLIIDGDYNMIENETYEEIKANGSATMKDFFYSDNDLPKGMFIDVAEMAFTPRYMQLKSFKSRIGRSDFSMAGKLENYLAYALKDGTLKGKLNHYSKLIDANDLMSMDSSESNSAEDSVTMEVVIVPKNIDFVLSSKTDKILYDKLTITNTKGKVTIRDGRVILDGLNMALLDGAMNLTGQYSTQDINKPFVDFDIKATNIDINKAAHSFSVVDSIVPIAKNAKGKVSAGFKYYSLLGEDSFPIMSSVSGGGNLKSKGIEISDSKIQNGIAVMLKNERYKKMVAKNLNVNFKLDKGNLIVEPFTANIYNKELKIQGKQGLDQSVDYKLTMPVSRKELANLAGFLGGAIPTSGDDVPVDIIVKGTTKDPEISLNLDKAKEVLGKELTKEADKVIDELIKDDKVKKQVNDLKKKLGNIFK